MQRTREGPSLSIDWPYFLLLLFHFHFPPFSSSPSPTMPYRLAASIQAHSQDVRTHCEPINLHNYSNLSLNCYYCRSAPSLRPPIPSSFLLLVIALLLSGPDLQVTPPMLRPSPFASPSPRASTLTQLLTFRPAPPPLQVSPSWGFSSSIVDWTIC